MDQTTFEKNYLMNTVQKTVLILRAFTREEPKLTLTDLHKMTGIGISSLQRFVATLVHEGFLIRDERTKQYQLGLSLFYLGKLVEQESTILAVAEPILKSLSEKIGESVSMSIFDGDQRRCILNYESIHSLTARNQVGDTSPLYAGASAKALLAYLPQVEIDDYLDRVKRVPITKSTVVDRTKLLDELELIRRQGYVKTKSERIIGACSISTPILSLGRPIASIAIIIPDVRYQDEQTEMYAQYILEAKEVIEKQLSMR
ncbi:IclR family transcriptional regulator [Lysinibacillus sp. SGAir0095]|uniref:IclR family transcriptional regulator n=1 Tax=Lysinibacillus sp. SGAir0095 TaxID=2070463 RepID=UPI0010CD472B|nr:IclR family transcriptional regulator [Lysinibacillus sp. SGAir0095]QCR31045.1 IclR family transcriptional regulator [Lysinibacillus sp. SGAir0095]